MLKTFSFHRFLMTFESKQIAKDINYINVLIETQWKLPIVQCQIWKIKSETTTGKFSARKMSYPLTQMEMWKIAAQMGYTALYNQIDVIKKMWYTKQTYIHQQRTKLWYTTDQLKESSKKDAVSTSHLSGKYPKATQLYLHTFGS